jgi:hypothetical protein
MKLSTFIFPLIVAFTAGSAALADGNPFDPVFAIMTLDKDDPITGERTQGCRGCHIGPCKVGDIPYFGDTQDEVEDHLITEDGGELIKGGWDSSIIADYLRSGYMPRGGVPWCPAQLEELHAWLDAVCGSSMR